MKFEIKGDDISDGYHTFRELYRHRGYLFLNLVRAFPNQAAWKRDHLPGWDCIYLELPTGQISYHVQRELRWAYEDLPEVPEYHYDGHTPENVEERLHDNIHRLRFRK